jgi:uncharacterized protein YcbK (DUF882 family)
LAVQFPFAARAADAARFFFSGDGVLSLQHAHFDERLDVRYRDRGGRYDQDALQRIARFFRSRGDGASGPIALRLIELIDYVEDRFQPRALVLVSGYRSPEFNQQLRAGGGRVAQASLHTEGIAADLQFPGLDLERLWRQLRALQLGGVGYYRHDGMLHLDTGRPRFWEPQTSKVEQNLSAGNARVFARTDFDRYRTLDGAIIQLHGVSALPLRIAPVATIGGRTLDLDPADDAATVRHGCLEFSAAPRSYRLLVRGDVPPASSPMPLVLATCPPRIESTPAEIRTNDVSR